MSLQKAVTKHTFKNLISLRIRSLLSLRVDISFSRFRQFLKPLAVLSKRYCYLGEPSKGAPRKIRDFVPKRGRWGKSDLGTTFFQKKNIAINGPNFKINIKNNLFVCEDFHFSEKVWILSQPGWQKLCGGTGGPRRKVRTHTKILSQNLRYFVVN